MGKRCQSDITHETDVNRMLQITFNIVFWTSPYFWRLESGLLALVINPSQPAFFATEHSSDSGANLLNQDSSGPLEAEAFLHLARETQPKINRVHVAVEVTLNVYFGHLKGILRILYTKLLTQRMVSVGFCV